MSTSTQASPPVQILIVEDSPTQAQRLQHLLEQQGYGVTHAANGRLALAAARHHKPTLIISDVVMPAMDGYELCRQVKADAGLGDLPVILTTSLSDPQHVLRSLECGADSFIAKPYDGHYLLGRVQFALLNHREARIGRAGPGEEIVFAGQRHFITADRAQILHLLLSSYDAALQRNQELDRAQEALHKINVTLRETNDRLERESWERQQAERALQESNTALERARSLAEKANLAKSEFLSSMSHELRSPLNAILGFGQLLASASPLLTATQTSNIDQILQAGWHLLELINEILDLSAIESGKVSLSTETVALGEVMSECEAMLESQAQPRGIRLIFPKFDHPVFVRADRTRLKQIVINLLSNAIKYNREQGQVVVEWTAIAPARIRISVKDTGAGLAPELLAQLFQPFNRLGQETGSVPGTGIGLVVTKRLAELMGGVLGVESTVGVGSVFWCELAAAAAPELADQGAGAGAYVQPEVPPDAPPRTVLYVEDNPANMMLVEQLIARRPDLRLLSAVDGAVGLELARARLPAVILMDINLPGISGLDAMRILRADPATALIPIVALSANALPQEIERGLQAGFFRYITKPIHVRDFMDTLNLALEFAGRTVDRSTLPPAGP